MKDIPPPPPPPPHTHTHTHRIIIRLHLYLTMYIIRSVLVEKMDVVMHNDYNGVEYWLVKYTLYNVITDVGHMYMIIYIRVS